MKNIIKYICVLIILLNAGCHPYSDWPDGIAELEHTYYVSNVKTGNGTEQNLQHEIAADGTATFMERIHYNPSVTGAPAFIWIESNEPWVTCPITLRFISERVRKYDAVSCLWIENRVGVLTPGVDYQVLTESGIQLTPNAQGAYSITWPEAKKGQQSIKIRRLTDKTGELRVMTLDRSRFAPDPAVWTNPSRAELDHFINNETSEYTVKSFWHDYNFPVMITFQ